MNTEWGRAGQILEIVAAGPQSSSFTVRFQTHYSLTFLSHSFKPLHITTNSLTSALNSTSSWSFFFWRVVSCDHHHHHRFLPIFLWLCWILGLPVGRDRVSVDLIPKTKPRYCLIPPHSGWLEPTMQRVRGMRACAFGREECHNHVGNLLGTGCVRVDKLHPKISIVLY